MALPLIGVSSITRLTSVAGNTFGKRLGAYKDWRDELAAIIGEYQAWVEAQGLGLGDDDLRVYELIDALKSDKLTIALVAEFSRGKTELINAIFFADYKQRLLPSDAGRTTMCPTELLYQENEPPCLKLLPIETRQSPLTITEYKRMPSHWKVLPLDLENPRAMADTLAHIMKTKTVGRREAQELGLDGATAPGTDQVRIPEFRHAIVNFPHPLLKHGLVLLDTPGLNSLGAEPELTLGMLPAAHAVLFVLAADTGVTKSDYEMWRSHLCWSQVGPGAGHLVALNKIDTLWDELHEPTVIATTLERQIEETARTLGVSREQVFPVSAQKGLLGKIKADQALVARSGLSALEERLSTDIVGAKQALLRDKIAREIGTIVENTRAMIEARLNAVNQQLTELNELSGKNQETIHQMIRHMRVEKQAYDKTLADFQLARAQLSQQTKVLLDYLSVDSFDALMGRIHTAMKESWTTRGLRAGMKTLFDGAADTMEKAHRLAQQILEQVRAAHEKFHAEHGLACLKPVEFPAAIYRARLQRLHEEAESFRKSPVTLITEQHFLIRKFFVTLAARARQIYADSATAALYWSKTIMAPVLAQAREHKLMVDARLENLKRVHENLGNLSSRINELETSRHNLENQLLIIDNMQRKIGGPATESTTKDHP